MEPQGAPEAGEGGWGCPGPRRRRRRRKRRPGGRCGAEDGSPAEAIERRLWEMSSELQSSDFWDSSRRTVLKALGGRWTAGPDPSAEAALENLRLADPAEAALELGTRPPKGGQSGRAGGGPGLRCVCYGAGSFSSCAKARCQLAFLLLLLRELEIPRDLCHIFDPVFSTLEIDILKHLGLTVIAENEEGKWCVSGPTVFYMIHCGKALYNNLLWRNWSPETLSKMAVIGNSFNGIEERMPAKIFQEEYGYIAKILTATSEDPFPSDSQYLDVFNDTSIHCFPSSKLKDLPQDIWTSLEEPVYRDEEHLEIIRKKQ